MTQRARVERVAAALVAVLALAPSGTAIAQSDRPAIVGGTVTDESGAVLPGVTVSARSLQAAPPKTAVTDSRGVYRLELDAGSYEIEAALAGFHQRPVQVALAAGDARTVDLVLQITPINVTETVTVTRAEQSLSTVPGAVTVIQSADIQSAQRQVLPSEALAGIPGLYAENRNNFSYSGGVRLSIRAPLVPAGMRGLQIVQDGIPLTTADGTTQPNNIDLGSEGRIEVIRGPSSALYGNSAGGVISLRTEFPPADRLLVQPDVQVGAYGYQRQQVKAEGTAGSVGYVFDVNRMQTDGFRAHSQADVRKTNAVVRVQLSPDTELRTVFNYYDMPFGASPSTLTRADALENPRSVRQLAIDQGWGEASSQGQGGVALERRFDGGRVLRVIGWGLWRSVWNPIPSRVVDLGRVGTGFRSEYSGSGHLGAMPIAWLAGMDLSIQRDDRNEFDNAGVPAGGALTREGALQLSQRENVRSAAPFAQADVTLAPHWRLTAGARYDAYAFSARDAFLSDGDQSGTRSLHAVSPKVGVTYLPTDRINAYVNFATAYQTPTTVELSNRANGQGGFNPDLQPATLRSFEAGARGVLESWRLRYEIVGYLSRLENAFVPSQLPDERTYYTNAGESARNGTEILLECEPIPRLTARLAYTYEHFAFQRFVTAGIDYSGRREPGTPPHQASLGATWDAPVGLRASAQLRWVDAYPVNNANTLSNWAYAVTDLRVGFDRKWKHVGISPFAGVDNLFNERYNGSTVSNSVANRAFEPSPDRSIYVGLRIGAGVL